MSISRSRRCAAPSWTATTGSATRTSSTCRSSGCSPSPTPSIVLGRDGRLLMVLGTPGGPTIINSVYQVIVNVVDHGMSLAEAVAAPRVHQQALPDVVFYERGGLAQTTLDGLRAMGYQLRERGRMGDIAAIERTAAGWVGVACPRRGGGAVGY